MPVQNQRCLRELTIRGVYTLAVVLAACAAHAQRYGPPDGQQYASASPATSLPESPGHILEQAWLSQPDGQSPQPPAQGQSVVIVAREYRAANNINPPPCRRRSLWKRAPLPEDTQDPSPTEPLLCVNLLDPYARFLDTRFSIPMTPAQKGLLALHNLADPFTFVTIAAASGVNIAIDSHTAYGPGWKGFGKLAGVSLLQDATGEFFGTFAIPSLVRQDPHYHRMPTARFTRRLLHAVSRTVIANHDDGTSMPNYATLLTYPIGAEIGNLYVPGIQTDGRSTARRILIGYALDPINNIVTEFVPDVAKRIHIRVIFVQQILNQVAASPASVAP